MSDELELPVSQLQTIEAAVKHLHDGDIIVVKIPTSLTANPRHIDAMAKATRDAVKATGRKHVAMMIVDDSISIDILKGDVTIRALQDEVETLKTSIQELKSQPPLLPPF